MKLLESFIYALVAFTGLYIIIAVAMRVFDLTDVFYAHVIAGVVATLAGVGLFMFFLMRKK
jgi:hypothetical protein